MFKDSVESLTDFSRFFLDPQNSTHRQYEALWAFLVEGLQSAEAAIRGRYTPASFRVLVHHFRQNPDRPRYGRHTRRRFRGVRRHLKNGRLRLRHCRFQRVLATQPIQAAPRVNLIPMNRVDLFARQKVGFLFQGSRCREFAYSARRRNRPACNVLVFRCASSNR